MLKGWRTPEVKDSLGREDLWARKEMLQPLPSVSYLLARLSPGARQTTCSWFSLQLKRKRSKNSDRRGKNDQGPLKRGEEGALPAQAATGTHPTSTLPEPRKRGRAKSPPALGEISRQTSTIRRDLQGFAFPPPSPPSSFVFIGGCQ